MEYQNARGVDMESPTNLVGPSASSVDLKKDGTASKMRSHKGNVPVLPKSKLCPHCAATFTRTTHLNRHLRTHTNERQHQCDTCDASFTRSDLLTRHKRTCGDPECVFLTATSAARRPSLRTMDEDSPMIDGKPPSWRTSLILKPVLEGLSTMAPPSVVPRINPATDFANLEFMTTSSNTGGITDSNYTPTDLQSALSVISGANHGFNSGGAYSGNMFEPLLSDIFSSSSTAADTPSSQQSDSPMMTEESFPFPTRAVDVQPFMASIDDEWFYEYLTTQMAAAPAPAPAPAPEPEPQPDPASLLPPDRISPLAYDVCHLPDGTPIPRPAMEELQHYLYLFLSAFQTQVPIVHPATWDEKGKPNVLLGAAKACGALFVKTRQARSFVSRKLSAAREDLVHEFAKNPTESLDQVHLIMATVLMQTIGLFHQQADQRASSHIYHGMLVMMIRSTGLIARNAAWTPPNLSEPGSLDKIWREWAVHEQTKRALLLSYMHDTCHCIYFAMPASYLHGEMAMYLPCEDALWKASTATEWFLALQKPSPYGTTQERLTGVSMPRVMAELEQPRPAETSIALNPFSHFILIHVILRNLFTACVQRRLVASSANSHITLPLPVNATGSVDEVVDPEIMTLQYALHNWLQSWLGSPELPRTHSTEEEPPFTQNALPYYWLAQVALLAYQENYPPFEPGSENNLKSELRFRMVKQWLRHIRGFLKKTDQAPTLFWDELMRIRLKSWQAEIEVGGGDDQEGLLGFFPES
ncbi:hypothetical protein HWV62_16106 [Athelia sp. TMB]|nr:hypothetical protein HWV62_16106 [Athelia sp. TMB]